MLSCRFAAYFENTILKEYLWSAAFDTLFLSKPETFEYFCEILLEREDYWMKTLRTTFPYSMNERTRNNDQENDTTTGKLFPFILRSIERSNRSRGKTDNV